MTETDAGPRYEGRPLTDVHHRGPAVSDPVTYTAVLSAPDETVLFVSALLAAERRGRGTRRGRRALGCYRQALLLLRWFLDGTRLAQLAADNAISTSTAYRYLHEGIDVLSAAAPGLRGALLAARAAGHTHVQVDGTLIRTDRCSVPGPTLRRGRSRARVDLWWSGKHTCHGGNVQVVTAPDGWPIWTSPVRPGREHDTTCLRAHAEVLPALAEWTDETHAVLGDLGYEGEQAALTTPVKKATGRPLTADERTVNAPARRHPGIGRARQLAAQGHVQGAAPGQSLPLADRRDHRRRSRPAPPPPRPHHMINKHGKLLLGMVHWLLLGASFR